MITMKQLNVQLEIAKDHSPYEPHRLSFYVVILVIEGELDHFVDFKTYHLKKGDALLISKGQLHSFSKEKSHQGYCLTFTDEFMHASMMQNTISKVNNLFNYFIGQAIVNCPLLNKNIIELINNELLRDTVNQSKVLGALLSFYLLKLEEQIENSAHDVFQNKNFDYFKQFKVLVERDYLKTRDAKAYASEICISYKHLNIVCKTIVGITAKAFIDNFVILEAKRMLVTTTLTVKEIAFRIGFEEPTNFLKYFKKHTHLTPAAFRKNSP